VMRSPAGGKTLRGRARRLHVVRKRDDLEGQYMVRSRVAVTPA